MIEKRLTIASLPATLAVLILFLSTSVDASQVLCTRGNITVFSAAQHTLIVTPDKCYPVPVIDRNQLHSKPVIRMLLEQPGRKSSYAVMMVEANISMNKYDLFWLDTNLTIDQNHLLVQNTSLLRDVRKIIEYRPPKASPYNLTYFIYVYRQPYTPVGPPRTGVAFSLAEWVSMNRLQLIGSAEFKVRANQQLPRPAPSIPHQPLPPAVIPHGSQSYPQPHPPPPGIINTVYHNISYPRNYTNGTHYRPAGPPPPYNPSYPSYNPNNQPYYPAPAPANKPKGKGAAVDLQSTTSLITLMVFLLYIFHV